MTQIDALVDRNILRRKLSQWRIAALLIIALFIFVSLPKSGRLDKSLGYNKDHIARIKIDGFLSFNQEILDNIADIQQNDKIKAVILHINSGGGTVVGGESLYYALRTLGKNKPLTVFMEEMAASAAYMTAIAGDHIVAHRGSITGSIGVLLESQEITELAKKVGVNFELYKSSPFKATPSLFEKTSPDAQLALQSSVNDIYNTFITLVHERRASYIHPDNMQFATSGRMFTGAQALELGLIDAVGDESAALEWLYANDVVDPSLKVLDYDLLTPAKQWNQFFNSVQQAWHGIMAMLNSNNRLLAVF